MPHDEKIGSDRCIKDEIAHGERAEVWKVQPGEGHPRRGTNIDVAMQRELRKGALQWGEDHGGEEGTPEVAPKGGVRAIKWAEIGEEGQMEESQGL